MLYLKGEKVCICGLVEVRKSQNLQIANPQSATFAEGPQI